MKDLILQLNDKTVVRVLTTIAKPHIEASGGETELTDEMREALRTTFESEGTAEAGSDGDLARHALQVLAMDDQIRQDIRTLILTPRPLRFLDPATAIGLTAALVFALKTSGSMKRDENGKLTWNIEWESLDNEFLKDFVDKLLSYIPIGPFK